MCRGKRNTNIFIGGCHMKKFSKWLVAATLTTSAFGLSYTAAAPSSVTQAQAASVMYSQVDYLNIRTSPSTKAKVVGQYYKNSKVNVLKSYSSKWYQVSYKGAKRYVSKAYVKRLPVAVANGYVRTGGANLNIRSGPGTGYKVIGKYKDGQLISLTSYDNPYWYQVVYKGKIGYVSADYVEGPFGGM